MRLYAGDAPPGDPLRFALVLERGTRDGDVCTGSGTGSGAGFAESGAGFVAPWWENPGGVSGGGVRVGVRGRTRLDPGLRYLETTTTR